MTCYLCRWWLEKQLNSIANFCSQNLMILNEMKTKILAFRKNQQSSNVKDIFFNGKVIQRSQKYKYLGNLLPETQTNQADIFRYTYEHLCNKARIAIFSIEKKLNHLRVLPPKIAIDLFKSNIEPVLTYGCEVWRFHRKDTEAIDIFPLRFLKHYTDFIMGAIASQITSLTIVYWAVYSGADQRNIKAPRHWPLCGEFTEDRWIPRTNGQ